VILSGHASSLGYRLQHMREATSTNDVALRAAETGDSGALWVVADQQTQGRGRHGRSWHSPEGNLFASLLLINP
jgi:BirA family biotin operon repressor/biotin-[acetyl-CoA-carboxylase] ligase